MTQKFLCYVEKRADTYAYLITYCLPQVVMLILFTLNLENKVNDFLPQVVVAVLLENFLMATEEENSRQQATVCRKRSKE
jgi:hypothetical protein